MSETWLRIVTYRAPDGDADAREYITESLQEVHRNLRSEPGFLGGRWAHDPDGTTLAAVTYWKSREAIESAGEFLESLRRERLGSGLKLGKEVNLQSVTPPAAWEPEAWNLVTSRDATTWLRVVFYDAAAGKDAEAVDHLRSSTHEAIRMLKEQAGFRVGYWGHDPVDGTMAAVTYWGGLQYIQRAGGELDRIHAQRGAHGGSLSDVLNLQLLHTSAAPAASTGWLPKTFGAA
ncbi:MAG: antibiotic biosynthesis monooxygenase [Sporichthyaceae bacterium]